MSLRFLLGALAPAHQRQTNQSSDETVSFTQNEEKDFDVIIFDYETPAKFHIGMLTLSLIAGLGFGGLIAYNCWMEKNIFLEYIRNLVIALTCRTFFSIIFDGAILLGTPLNVGGGNSLLSFEQICLNLVLAFWLTLTIYLHARVQRNFNSEPTLKLYQYGVPGVGVFFVFVWIFTLQDQWPSRVWWIFINPISQWIVNSINLLYILIQLALVVDIGRMMQKTSLDNDSISLLRKVAIMMGVLVLIFWFQFGFTIGRVPLKNPSSYVYFFYFIDGLECALVCLTLYFFNKWVLMLINKVSATMIGLEEPPRRMPKPKEKLLTGNHDRGIVTIDSVFMTRESEKWNNLEKEGAKDVVYSSVVGPQRLQKTLQLYKRLNIIPTNQVTVVDGETFYDCKFQGRAEDSEKINLSPKQIKTLVSDVSKQSFLNDDNKFKSDKVCERTQKKNAFYSSKYLILDSKENDIPKYLETRPSVSTKSERESFKDERINENLPSTSNPYMSDELVRKWLHENSENMQKKKETTDKNKQKPQTGLKTLKHSMLETSGNTYKENDDQNSKSRIVSTINSVVSGVFRSSKNEKKRLSQDSGLILKKEQNDSIPSPKSDLNLQEKQTPKNDKEAIKPITTGLSEQNDILQYENETKKPKKTVKTEVTKVLETKNGTEAVPKPEILNSEETVPARETEEKIMDGTVDAEVSDAKECIEKPLNQYLTYEELQEFRSQQAKLNPDQPPEGNNSFSWSETISSTIGSLINASSTFFNGKIVPENNEIQNFYRQNDDMKEVINTKSDENIESDSEKNTNKDFTFEQQIQSQTNTPEPATRNRTHKLTEDVPSIATPDSITELEVPQEDTNKLKPNPSILVTCSTPNLQEGSSNDQNEIFSQQESKSKNTSSLDNEGQHNDVPIENLPMSMDTKNHQILDEDEQNEISELELQSEKHDISKNELFLKSKNEDSSSKHRLAHKAEKQRILKKSKKSVPQSGQSLGAKGAEELGPVLPEEQRASDTSLESEFKVEKKPLQTPSNEVSNALSQQQYSPTPIDMEEKFRDHIDPLQDIHNLKNKS